MKAIKLSTTAMKRVLPTHELNARRNRKRDVLPHLPVTSPPGTFKQATPATAAKKG